MRVVVVRESRKGLNAQKVSWREDRLPFPKDSSTALPNLT